MTPSPASSYRDRPIHPGPTETEPSTMSKPERRAPVVALRTVPLTAQAPTLDDMTRRRLGRELRALYDPVIDEPLDPRLAELMQQWEADRGGSGA
jgi:hypothetical protein